MNTHQIKHQILSGVKTCPVCKKIKKLNCYYSNKAKSSGVESACIPCFKKSIKKFKSSSYKLDVTQEQLANEQWADLYILNERFPYKISDCGRVMVEKRQLICKPSLDQRGYPQIVVTSKTKRIGRRIHVLVANTFKENPYNLREVNHIDGNKFNSHISNLEFNTSKQNKRHSIEMGLWKPNYKKIT